MLSFLPLAIAMKDRLKGRPDSLPAILRPPSAPLLPPTVICPSRQHTVGGFEMGKGAQWEGFCACVAR